MKEPNAANLEERAYIHKAVSFEQEVKFRQFASELAHILLVTVDAIGR